MVLFLGFYRKQCPLTLLSFILASEKIEDLVSAVGNTLRIENLKTSLKTYFFPPEDSVLFPSDSFMIAGFHAVCFL